MTKPARVRILASALLLCGLSAAAWPQSQQPAKTTGPKPADRQITLTLVRWPYT